MAELARRARRLGLSPASYPRRLVEEDLALDRKSRTTTLAQIIGVGRQVDEDEFDALVEAARTRHHSRTSAGK